jgi:imidazole glycerol-phosphate synthase subunit HisH
MTESPVTIVDYGMGNLGSIANMFKKLGAPTVVARSAVDVAAAQRLVLPGVGSFDTGMRHLGDTGLREVLDQKATQERVPTLGICLGMQLLMHRSDEGELAGLGWIDGEVRRLTLDGAAPPLRLPHMGWNTVDIVRPDGLYAGMTGEVRFYFVHSYGVACRTEDDVLSTTTYGETFVSALRHGNIFGTQFHPEKSHRFGMQLLKNFLRAE